MTNSGASMLEKLSRGASILGLMVVGGMIFNMVNISIPVTIGSGEAALNIQDTLDGLFPGLLSVLITMLVYFLIKKGVKSTTLIVLIFVICVAITCIGTILL